LKTLGDHIRKRCLDLDLLQREVAAKLGVTPLTITNWEGNATTPMCHYTKRILEFLGYNPSPPPRTLAEKLVRCRMILGLSQEKLAKRIGVAEDTVADWEAERHRPTKRSLQIIEESFRRNLLFPVE